MGEVDPAFFQDPEHRPRIVFTEAEGIPLIDLSPILSSGNVSAVEGLVSEIRKACKEWGFFQVINHGVPLEKRQRIEAAARKFFAQSLDDKRKVRRNEKEVLGYYETEHTKNVWSNDEYESVEHRAMVNSERELKVLHSIFLQPGTLHHGKPLEELTTEQNPAKYRAYSWGSL